jgi:hypothetical protein
LNGTDFYTVLNIPVVLVDLKGGDSTACTQNAIVTNIAESIPIPRPLGKVNGVVVAHFEGSNSDSGSGSNGNTNNGPESGGSGTTGVTPTNSGKSIPLNNSTNNPQSASTTLADTASPTTPPFFSNVTTKNGIQTTQPSPLTTPTTPQTPQQAAPRVSTIEIFRTSTIQAKPQPTSSDLEFLDRSSLGGGPGGDLTDVGNQIAIMFADSDKIVVTSSATSLMDIETRGLLLGSLLMIYMLI